MSHLLVTRGPLLGARLPLAPLTLIGRTLDCTVWLPGPSVSRRHALIERTAAGWTLSDDGSRNGTWLNGARLSQPAALHPGDTIAVGDHRMLFDPPASLLAARFGGRWLLLSPGEEPAEIEWLPRGGSPLDAAMLGTLAELTATTTQEEALVTGVLRSCLHTLGAHSAALLRGADPAHLELLSIEGTDAPCDASARLLGQVWSTRRGASALLPRRQSLRDGALTHLPGQRVLYVPAPMEPCSYALCVMREVGDGPFPSEPARALPGLLALLAPALENARRIRLAHQRQRAGDPHQSSPLLGGHSETSRALTGRLKELAEHDGPVLLVAPAGMQEERLVRTLHAMSARWEGPLLSLSCGTLSETQLELLLLGQPGEGTTNLPPRTLLADGGILYLERLDLSSDVVQERVLRLLQTRRIPRPDGSAGPVVDLRVVCSVGTGEGHGALRADLAALFAEGRVEIPTLQQRQADLPLIAEAVLAQLARGQATPTRHLSPSSFEVLSARPWRGGLTELEEVLTRAIALSGRARLTREDLQLAIESMELPTPGRLSDTLKVAERSLLQRAMSLTNHRPQEAARALGMGLAEFERRWKELGGGRPSSQRPPPD